MSQDKKTNSSRNSRLPVFFFGHGSPMNAIEENNYTHFLTQLGRRLSLLESKLKAVLCISAHWTTRGSAFVTRMKQPRTIHDFSGFPPELYQVQYPAPGYPELADEIIATLMKDEDDLFSIKPDDQQWGFDHGCWSVLRFIYPQADIPVLQLSLNMNKDGEYHYRLGEKLKPFRDQNVLIVGSGNTVHNLGYLNWSSQAKPLDWAVEFDEWIKTNLGQSNHQALVHDFLKTSAGQISVANLDHYYPFLTILGASDVDDHLTYEFEGYQNASISMLSMSWGNQRLN